MRLAIVIVSATVLGLIVAITATNWYTYDLISGPTECRRQYAAMAIAQGWEIVPNQPDPCYVRRPRIHLP